MILSIIGLLFAVLIFYNILNYEKNNINDTGIINIKDIQKPTQIKEELALPIEKKAEIKTEPTQIKEEVVDDCPQFKELVMKYSDNRGKHIVLFNQYSAYSDKSKSINGWKIQGGWNYIGDRFFICHKGNIVSQNVKNYYCGDDKDTLAEAKKEIIDQNGNIIKMLKKEIILVYDENSNYIETICTV